MRFGAKVHPSIGQTGVVCASLQLSKQQCHGDFALVSTGARLKDTHKGRLCAPETSSKMIDGIRHEHESMQNRTSRDVKDSGSHTLGSAMPNNP